MTTGEQLLKSTLLSYGSSFAEKPEVTATAWALLKSEKHKAKIVEMRAMTDPDRQSVVKKSLPVMYGGGVFTGIADADIQTPSGFIIVDIDVNEKENQGKTVDQIFTILKGIEYVVACAVSVRGKGVFAICRIKKTMDPSEYKRYYTSISKDFAAKDLKTDSSCKNISRKRFTGYSGRIWINPINVSIHQLSAENQASAGKKKHIPMVSHSTSDKINWLADQIDRRGLNICENYDDYFAVACSLAVEVGESGRGIFHQISRQSSKYDHQNAEDKYNNALQNANRSSIGAFYNKCKAAGINTAEFKQVYWDKIIQSTRPKKNIFTYRDGSTINLNPEYGYPASWDLITL